MSDFWKMALEAAGWTALEMFVVTFAAGFATISQGDWDALMWLAISAGLSAMGAAVSIIKSVIVRNIGKKNSTLITG